VSPALEAVKSQKLETEGPDYTGLRSFVPRRQEKYEVQTEEEGGFEGGAKSEESNHSLNEISTIVGTTEVIGYS